MYRYLENKTADFTTETLSVKPTTILPQTGDKNQVVHEFDDGSVSVVGVSTSNSFTVELQWSYISLTDHATLMDFWFSETKGAGRSKTFYWLHPIDGKIYTVRFMTPLTSSYDPVGNLSVSTVTLRVEGTRPFLTANPTTASTLVFTLSLPAEKEVVINWGDEQESTVVGPITSIDYSNSYAAAGAYPITLSGDYTSLTALTSGDVSVGGDISDIAVLSELTRLDFGDSNTISGNVADLPTTLTYFSCEGSNTISDYTTKTWAVKPATLILVPTGVGGLSESEIDQLFIDLDTDLTWASGDIITLTGTNAAPSATSATARSNIIGEGCAVTKN